ncbi:MAG: site-2 protease family protein [Betaproteobacteria bacterium]|nr:site-2 protease family protein [Betaproteobacteria bacterium]
MDVQGIILNIAIYAIPAVFAITLHEAGHAYAAKFFGDKTAWMLGRLSLNPARHIDPVGTILVPILTSFSGFVFGWAKPVPVNFQNLRDPKRDMFWVAAAGPGANLAMALAWVLVAKVLLTLGGSGIAFEYWIRVSDAGIKVNVMFAVLNLFPLLPLDGGRIVTSLLPDRLAYQYSRLEPYGMVILILLIVSGALSWMIGPVMGVLLKNLYSLLGF